MGFALVSSQSLIKSKNKRSLDAVGMLVNFIPHITCKAVCFTALMFQ